MMLVFLYDTHFLRGLSDIDVYGVVRDLHRILELVYAVQIVIAVEPILLGT